MNAQKVAQLIIAINRLHQSNQKMKTNTNYIQVEFQFESLDEEWLLLQKERLEKEKSELRRIGDKRNHRKATTLSPEAMNHTAAKYKKLKSKIFD